MQPLFSNSWAILFVLSSVAVSSPVYNSRAATSPAAALAGLGINSTAPIPVGDVSFTCKIFQELFPRNETFSTNSAFYTPLYEIPWSQTCWLEPACITTPSTAQDLSKVMIVLNALQTKFAVRSGGHTDAPGFNGVGSDGVLVALQNLNKLAISSDKKIATVGTGNRWGAVYKYVAEYGVNVVGGREPMVGVGGFLLGGGLSLFYNTYGLGLDQITRYQVVLTDGRIVDATPTQNADLYRALKGGLTNFGVVTEFDLMTNSNTQIYYEIYLYDPERTPAILEAYSNYLTNPEVDLNSSVEIQVAPGFSLIFLGYNGHTNRPVIFNEFYAIPTRSTFFPPTNGTFNDVVFGVDGNATSPGSTYSITFSHKLINANFLLESYQAYRNLSATLPPGLTFYYVPQGITPNLVTQGKARNGGNVLGLTATPQIWVNTYIDYSDINNTPIAQASVNTLVTNLVGKAQAENISLPYIYVNDAGATQKPLRSFGDQNFNYIKNVAAKYDRDGVMQKRQNNGYLISNEP